MLGHPHPHPHPLLSQLRSHKSKICNRSSLLCIKNEAVSKVSLYVHPYRQVRQSFMNIHEPVFASFNDFSPFKYILSTFPHLFLCISYGH